MEIDVALKQIQSCVSKWTAENPQVRNISRLAMLTGYSRLKISRTLSNETGLNFSIAAAILNITASFEVMREILERTWPREYELVRALHLKSGVNQDEPKSAAHLDEEPFLFNPTSLAICYLAANINGISLTEVINEFGRKASKYLRILENHGILKSSNSRFFLQALPLATPIQQAHYSRSMIDLYEESEFQGKNSWMHVRIGYLDEEMVLKFKEKEREFLACCDKMMQSSTPNKGRLFSIALHRHTYEAEE